MPIVSLAKVFQVRELSKDIKEYLLEPEMKTNYEPGQFLQLSLDKIEASEPWRDSRTFSIASFQTERNWIRLVIKNVGEYTERIFKEMQEGTVVTLKYAFGDFLLPYNEESKILCVAGGTGITPFLSFLDYLEKKEELDRIRILYSVRHRDEAFYYDEIRNKIGKNVILFTTRENREDSINRRIEFQDILQVSNAQTEVYICGSEEFNQSMNELLQKEGYQNIHLDEW